jgi:HEAT repeat protein
LGILSSKRLPGVRGKRSAFERELSLRVLDREKVFLLGKGEEEEWFAKAEALLIEQRKRQGWQRFVSGPSSEHDSWEAEALWWETEQDEVTRALRMKRLVLTHLQGVPPSQRQLGLAELERVLAMDGTGSIADLDPLLGLLEEEAFYTERCRRMVTLARGLIHGDAEPARRARLELLDVLVGRFGDACAESVAALLYDVDSDQLLSMSADERPLVRALIAVHFSGSKISEERAVLLALLDDEDPSVEAAAVASLGHARLEGARTDLLVRARFAEGVVRLAALEAAGRLGGEGVRQALVTGLAERDEDVQLAALRGLAHLKDPASVSLFVSYLQQAPDSPMFSVSLGALESFGDAAHEDLLRVASSTLHKARRPAALLLARAGVGAVADPLAVFLGLASDLEVARELAILTCFDLRDADEPGSEYLAWLRSEGDRDAWRWFVEATARREFTCPARDAFEGRGTREAALFLHEVMARCESFLAERARRELERMIGVELVELPVDLSARRPWVESAREFIDRAYGQPGGGE